MKSHKCWTQTLPGAKNITGTGQLKFQDVMKNRSGNRATAIAKSIGVFIAKDRRPYSVVFHVVRTLIFCIVESKSKANNRD